MTQTTEKYSQLELIERAEKDLAERFEHVDKIAFINQRRVLNALRKYRLTEEFFAERTGYGRNDAAREFIDNVFAEVMGAESAAVRMQLVSGTHALACALLGNLKAGQRLACITGKPYDTLEKVIGHRIEEPGSLKDLGVDYIEGDVLPLVDDQCALRAALTGLICAPTKIAYIQKSCGYSFARRALFNHDIELIGRAIKEINPDCQILVDNCYGEFVEDCEPPAASADLIAGSLIKNPGGGLALTGGYIAGRKQLVDAALNRLTSPGIGGHLGLTYNQNRLILQGLFTAPAVVANAVKGAMLFAAVFEKLGFEVAPGPKAERSDIIQGIKFGSASRLTGFLKALQSFSPVNSHLTPEPALMPGYEDKVIMAGGTFIDGATIELSGDGPLRPPFAAFVQGGLTYQHVRLAIAEILEQNAAGDYHFSNA